MAARKAVVSEVQPEYKEQVSPEHKNPERPKWESIINEILGEDISLEKIPKSEAQSLEEIPESEAQSLEEIPLPIATSENNYQEYYERKIPGKPDSLKIEPEKQNAYNTEYSIDKSYEDWFDLRKAVIYSEILNQKYVN